MATVETILDKIENIKDSKSKIINTLLKNGVEVSQDTPLKEIPDIMEEQPIGVDGIALNKHINTLATTNQYGHVRLATSLDDNDTGVVPSIELLNGEFSNKFATKYVPLSGGTVNGTLTIDTSDVVGKAPLELKVHTKQEDPYRPLIVVRDETGSEFVTMSVKRAEWTPAYTGQFYIGAPFTALSSFMTSKCFWGSYGVAPTTGRWSDAGGAWKFDLIKGEIAITDNGWDSDENATPKSTTFLRFTDILKSSDVPSWAKQETKPTYTASEVGAQPAGKYVTYDTTSTDGSENLVSSSAIKTYIDSIVGDIKSALEAL